MNTDELYEFLEDLLVYKNAELTATMEHRIQYGVIKPDDEFMLLDCHGEAMGLDLDDVSNIVEHEEYISFEYLNHKWTIFWEIP